jgi:putative membrane-bound dehydrogenase-like protein
MRVSFATRSNLLLSAILFAATPSLFAQQPAPPAQDASQQFQLVPGLKLELVAQEPLVVSPCALAFDERGRMFVAENRGYPTGPPVGKPPSGRVAMLEDLDHDGKFEKRTEFALGLNFPNGVMPWRGGLIVTCAPDVLYLKDTDGDGRADERRVLLTGYSTAGSTQLRVSHPTLSMDNWVYLTSGLMGGKVVSPLAPQLDPLEFKRTDLRFQPDSGIFQAADGGAQFGQTFDDFGRRFICYNRVQVQHVVLSSASLRRNRHLAFSDTIENCPAEMVREQLKGHGDAAKIFPISQNVTTADSHAGTFTAACGVTVYRGSQLPPEYRGGVFSCEPTANLVHFDRLQPHGATFSAHRLHPACEVVATVDDWFRPVFLANAPDGAIYVCDMYRKTIEHPDYLPEEIRKHTDFESGKDKGRIYRLVGEQPIAQRPTDLANASIPELCEALKHVNGWYNDTAHRLLLERKDPSAIPTLKRLIDEGTAHSTDAVACVHALHLLEAFDALDDAVLETALSHSAAPVREQAIQIATPRINQLPKTAERIIKLASDTDPRVRLNVAIALGEIHDNRVLTPLAVIALAETSDRWTRAAVLSSIGEREPTFLDAMIVQAADAKAGSPELFYELGRILSAGQPDDVWPQLLSRITAKWPKAPFEQQIPLIVGIAEGLRNRGKKNPDNIFRAVLSSSESAQAPAMEALGEVIKRSIVVAVDESQPVEERRWAVALAAHTNFQLAGEMLLKLIEPRQPEVVQNAAVRALAGMEDKSVVSSLLASERFGRYTPRVREQVLAALTSSNFHISELVSALEQKTLDPAELDSTLRQQLVNSRDKDIQARAAKLFGSLGSDDRAAVYEDYRSVVSLPCVPENGRVVFKRVCATCHRLDREGVAVGPDLFGIRNQTKEAILLHVLVPDREITTGFTAYTAQTLDGRVLTGLISSETPTSITLRQPLGKEETLLRQDIEELIASKTSLMPRGVEQSVSRQEFADLLAYLKGEMSAAGAAESKPPTPSR